MVSVRIIVAFRSITTKVAFLLLSWSVFAVKLSNGQCKYSDKLTSTHPVRYIQYQYKEAVSCSWTAVSDYKINLSCTVFELPWSDNCLGDRLAVQINPSVVHRYCGNGSFNIQSESNSMVITLQSMASTNGGRFFCEVRALFRPQNPESCSCGRKNPSRIVGGTNAGVNEFPMMCGIVDATQRSVFCGATIISDKYVLTAAHCIINRDVQNLGVLVGDHDLETGADTNATVLHRVIQAIIHPRYSNNENDVAILKTEKYITFNNQVGPVCLPFQHSPDTFGGDYVELLGWGTTDFGGPTSDILQKVTVSVLTNWQCSEIYPSITTDQICTYAKDKDSCQMDSGGPVLWQNPTTRRLVLIGIISMGRGCAVTAGLNTRVGAYIDWIVSVTPDAWYCTVE